MYEPYFSPRAAYEGDAVLARFGVSTVTTYDAVGRTVRVDLPNGTHATTAPAAWATTAATPGDNVLDSTYRVVREGRPVDDAERVAYEHAAGHAGTPTVTHVDARGVVCATRAVGDASAADAWTRQVLDATGQASAVIDARGLTAFTYVRDLRGRVVAQGSVDAGPTWAVADAYDRPVWTWDGRGFAVTRGFDVADRPTTVSVTGGDGAAAMDAMVETYIYGDQAADRAAAVAANTVGRLVEVKDGAGVVAVTAYDPLGAVRAQGRQLRGKVNEDADWRGAEAVESEVLATAARTDALGREVWTQLVDGTARATVYARGEAMVEVRVTTPDGALVATPIVADVARDAHGRVVAATLGNGVGQTWAYDPASGRLVAQDAVRGTRAYQGLRCTYDPDGKLVRMLDAAQDGPGALVPGAVSARRDFGYDAHGRLVAATGRVHQALLPHDGPTTAGCVHGARHLSLNNGAALERYTQQFTYDAGGNLTRVQHAGATASWATDYWVAAGSNRATAAVDGNGVSVVNPAAMFDAGGNLRELWHLRAMGWSWRGCLTHATTVVRAGGPVDDGERYAYGADRVRVRKVATRLVVGGAEPVVETREVVYCGGGQERVRVRRNGTLVLERWTTHVGDGDRRVAVIDRHVVDTLANEVDAIGPARVRYHLTTPQGSTAVELDEAGQLISYEEYLPHGGSAFIAGDDVREVARRDVRYAGKERDRATGLDAYPQRYYAPWLGRWLSPDPIGPKDGLNLYAFVGGDPVGYVDPEGTERKRAADEECRPRPMVVGVGEQAADESQAATPAWRWNDWQTWRPSSTKPSRDTRGSSPVAPSTAPESLVDPRGYDFGATDDKATADAAPFDPFGGGRSGGIAPRNDEGQSAQATPQTAPAPIGLGLVGHIPVEPLVPAPVALPPSPVGTPAPAPAPVPSVPSVSPVAGPAAVAGASTIGEVLVSTGVVGVAIAPGVAIGGVGYVSFTRGNSIGQFGTPYGGPRDCLGAPVLCQQRGKPSEPVSPGIPVRGGDPAPSLEPGADSHPLPSRTQPIRVPYRWVPYSPLDPAPGERPTPASVPEADARPQGQHVPAPIPPAPVPSLPTATQPSPSPGPASAPQPSPTSPNPPPRQAVNLDTGAIIATTSLKRPWQLLAMNAFLVTKEPLVTQTALGEFFTGPYNAAGPNERLVIALFLMSVRTIPDSPSARVMALNVGSRSLQKKLGQNDRIIFGTGDQLGIPTVTADQKFVGAAAKQGVFLWVQMIAPPPRYLGI
ncbi:MAG: DUF1308 domain-containing protein [Myxococcales bacterium]|nr:DUF1308 domain-containing protein [Myxococcales bacterium]MBP6842590.1 DUF1308 domain-containing protein [Kofleriaceae bacterium]